MHAFAMKQRLDLERQKYHIEQKERMQSSKNKEQLGPVPSSLCIDKYAYAGQT